MSTWDDQAVTLDAARFAVWGTADWDAGVALCVGLVTPALDEVGELGGRILDFGCGIGRMLMPLADRWPTAILVGYDTSVAMLHHAVAATGARSNVSFADEWEHVPSTLDGAYSVLTFQHMRRGDQAGALRILGRRLRSGAPLVLQFVSKGDEGPLNHPVPTAQMTAWCRCSGFDVIKVGVPPARPTWRILTAVRV